MERFEAVEKLGRKLEARKMLAGTVVVDRVSKMSTANWETLQTT